MHTVSRSRSTATSTASFGSIAPEQSRAEPAPAKAGGMTQFGRSLHALNIDILCANTPQAKGRVERANKTLQDRLVKELRLQGINTIAAGNELLPGFLADYNARFGKEPRNPKNLHRALTTGDDLADVFAWREERTVSSNLTLQYDKVVFLLEPNEITRDPQARHRYRLSRWPAGDPLPWARSALHHVRQAAAGRAGHHRREQAPWRRPLAYPRQADRTRRGSQSVRSTPPGADRPHVQSRLKPDPLAISHTGTARRHCLSVPFSATDETP